MQDKFVHELPSAGQMLFSVLSAMRTVPVGRIGAAIATLQRLSSGGAFAGQWPTALGGASSDLLLDDVLNLSCLSSVAMAAISSGLTAGSCLLSAHSQARISSNRRSDSLIENPSMPGTGPFGLTRPSIKLHHRGDTRAAPPVSARRSFQYPSDSHD